MDCTTHRKPFQFICNSQGCNLTLLCSDCRKNHLVASNNDRNVHAAQIITLRRAFEQAQMNINSNLRNLRDLIMPFQNEQKIFRRIQQQKQRLIQERKQIIDKITMMFQRQIDELEATNRQTKAYNRQSVPFDKIEEKIKKLEQAQKEIKRDYSKLREMLVYSQDKFINQLRRNSTLSSMNLEANQYYIYEDTKHDFFLSRLQLKRKTLNNKLLQKVQNQSDLYFLIQDYKQGNYLHYFSSGERVLRLYNLDYNKWSEKRFEMDFMPNYGATVYEPMHGRFYLIGGEVSGKKSNMIYWFGNEGWRSAPLLNARSSAMATILYEKNDKIRSNHYILIVGGVGDQGRNLKTCEIFSSKHNRCFPAGSVNFAVNSGTLITFNDSIAFRIGGLGQFQKGVASICEIAEKCDYSKMLQLISESNQAQQNIPMVSNSWIYVDLQVVNSDISKKYNLFYAHQAGIQINPNQMLIFGGMSHNNRGVNESYIVQVECIKNKFNQQSYRYYVRWINQKPLVSAQGFLGLRPIVYKKKVMSLQNISCGQSDIYQQEKRLIEFNMYDWREIENIVDI